MLPAADLLCLPCCACVKGHRSSVFTRSFTPKFVLIVRSVSRWRCNERLNFDTSEVQRQWQTVLGACAGILNLSECEA